MAKAADAEPDACSAAAADAEAEAEAIEEAESGEPVVGDGIVAAACDPAFDDVDATVGTAVPETVEVPMTDAPATSPEGGVPLTLGEAAGSDAVLLNDVTESVEEDVDVDDADVGDEDDEGVDVTSTDDDVADEETEDEEEDVADDVSLTDVELEEELLPSPEPLFCGLAFIVIEHFLTSSTAGLPLLSVMGVRVTTHVSVIAPATVSAVCTVNTVVDRPFESVT